MEASYFKNSDGYTLSKKFAKGEMKKVIPISRSSLALDNITDQYVSPGDATVLCERLKTTISKLVDEVISEIRVQDKDHKEGGYQLSLCQLLQEITSRVSQAIAKEVKDNDTSPNENHREVPYI